MKKIFLLVFIVLMSSCSSLGGLADEGTKSQIEFENKIQNTSSQNFTYNSSSISNTLIDSINSLNNLQKELESLGVEIDVINSNLKNVSSNEVDSETLAYLNELNTLTEKSKKFVSALYDSTKIWDSYLSTQSYDPRELKPLNDTEFVDLIQKPFEVWK